MARQIEEIILKVSVDDRGAADKINRLGQGTGETEQKVQGLSLSFKTLRRILAGLGLKAVATQALDVAIQFDKVNNSLKSVLGNQQLVNKEIKFLSDLSDDLGLNLLNTADAYSKVVAAAKGTKIEGKGARDILQGVSDASTSLGLSADETGGALRAINQIISKGKVQAEELRGQLGERIPGAFQIAARSMGKTTQELDKMLEQGELLSEDFIPKFSQQLKKEFGETAVLAANSAQASINRLNNEWQRSLAGMGQAITKMVPAFQSLLRGINDIGKAVVETKDDINLFITALNPFGDLDLMADLENAEAARLIAMRKINIENKKNAESMKAQKDSANQLKESLEKLKALNQIGIDIMNAERLQDVREELNLTTQEFNKLSPAILDALSKGANYDDIIESTRKFVDAFKDSLNTIEEVTIKIDNPFDKLLKDAMQFNEALDLSKSLGLSKKEFEKISGALKDAIDKNIDPEVIRSRLAGLRDLGFFDDKKEVDKTRASSEPVQSAFQVGTAAASEFLQSTKLNEERNKLLKDIAESSRKRSENPPVSLVSKSGGL